MKRPTAQLDRRLRAARPEARDELVSTLAQRVGRRPYARPRLGLAFAATLVLLSALVVSGGVGYAAHSVGDTVKAVKKIVIHPKKKVAKPAAKSKSNAVAAAPVSFPVRSPAAFQYGCDSLKISVRWHYKVTTKTGGSSWSATKDVDCVSGQIIIGPSTMEGDLKIPPGGRITAGYDFKVSGFTGSVVVTFANPMAVFNPRCGSSPSTTTLTVPMPTQSYTVTTNNWYPSGDQSSPSTYQGNPGVVVPDLCNGGVVRFNKGGTFSAQVSI